MVMTMGYSFAMAKQSDDSKRIVVLDGVLEEMEAHVGVAGTLELHDPLYAWRHSAGAEDLAQVQAACARFPDHPIVFQLQESLAEWLGGVIPQTQSLGSI